MRVSRSVPHFLNDDKRWKEDVGGWGNGRPFAFLKKNKSGVSRTHLCFGQILASVERAGGLGQGGGRRQGCR